MSGSIVQLGDVADFINGCAFKPSDWTEDGLPIVRIQNLTGNGSTFNKTELDVPAKHRVTSGDLLVSWSASLGVFQWTGPEAVVNQHIFKVVPDLQKVDLDYLRHAIDASIHEMERFTHGSTMKHINRKEFLEHKIPLPPLAEQRRIASILDKADALRRKRKRALELLDTLTQSVFLEMFGDPIRNPRKWPVGSLGSVCDVRDGTHASPTYVKDGFPLLTSKNFSGGKLDYTGAKLISSDDYDEINRRSKVDIGDIVMPMIGTIGSPVLIRVEPRFAIKNVALFKFGPESPIGEYVIKLLDGPLLQAQISKVGRGGTQKFLALKDLRSLLIPLPPKGLQLKFRKLVEPHLECIARYSSGKDSVDALFTSLQHRAFSGQL